MAYYVSDFEMGRKDSAGNTTFYVNRAISTDIDYTTGGIVGDIGTVILHGPGYVDLGITFDQFYDILQIYDNDVVGLFNELGLDMFYFTSGDKSECFSAPLTVTDSPSRYFSLGGDLISGIPSYGTFNDKHGNPKYLIIASREGRKDPYFNPEWLDYDVNRFSFVGTANMDVTYVKFDSSITPTDVSPIPPNNSELPAPGITYFGLTLGWPDLEITVDDYNVHCESEDFDHPSFTVYNNGQELEISGLFDGVLDVNIYHNVYDVSATAHYGVRQTGPYDEGGVQGPTGGNGNFNDGPSDDIRPLVPSGSAGPDTSNVGLYTRYLMTSSQIKDFGDYLYADDIVESITKGIMKALFDSPAEAVISLMHYPFDVSSLVSTSGSEIYYGNISTGKSSSGIMNRSSARIEWGTLPLTEYWGNFLDYAPHTKIDLYLPWCTGSVPIDPHECLPGTIEVITNIEFDKGTCVHNVIGNKGALIGTYSGVVGTQIPVTALDTAGKALSFVTAAVSGIVAAGATGASMAAGSFASQRVSNAMGFAAANSAIPPSTSQIGRAAYEARIAAERPYTGIQRGAGRVAATASAAAFRVPPNITRNGSFSGNGASLAVQVPFIIISRPTQSVPQNYGKHYGYPSNIYASLGSLVGYTEVGSVHLDGFTCTVEERNEIGELLMGGVVL